jgi:hypothetical protein
VALKISYLLMRWLFGLAALVFRGDRAKDAELLVSGTRTRRSAGTPAGSGTSQPTAPGSPR